LAITCELGWRRPRPDPELIDEFDDVTFQQRADQLVNVVAKISNLKTLTFIGNIRSSSPFSKSSGSITLNAISIFGIGSASMQTQTTTTPQKLLSQIHQTFTPSQLNPGVTTTLVLIAQLRVETHCTAFAESRECGDPTRTFWMPDSFYPALSPSLWV
jgi:hypothetical protein